VTLTGWQLQELDGELVEVRYEWVLASAEPEVEAGLIAIVPLTDFAAREEIPEPPLVGDDDKKLIARDSSLVLYGEGGSGKTTLAIDLGCHLGAGADWLSFPIGQPVRVMLLENEGPRHEFRLKLRRKLATWRGPDLAGNVYVYEAPWGRLDLRNQTLVGELADEIRRLEVDVVIAGPVRRLGLEGGGTPAETVAFMALLDHVRAAVGRPLAFVLVHHENKGGDISGAFEAEFDTVVHAQADGRNRTKLTFRKSRWSSRIHRARATLAWIPECEGFAVVESDLDTDPGEAAAAKEAQNADARRWIVEHVESQPGPVNKTAAAQAYHDAHGGGRNLAARIIDGLVDEFERFSRELPTLLAEHPNLEASGKQLPTLATTTGKAANGVYLVPFAGASFPLPALPIGKHGEQPPEPLSHEELPASPPPPGRGGEREAPGEGQTTDTPGTSATKAANAEPQNARGAEAHQQSPPAADPSNDDGGPNA
jgi:hypothetical protein